METFDAAGKPLDAVTFIQAYRAARKMAGPRFIKVLLSKATYDELVEVSNQPEVIQIGKIPAPGGLGRTLQMVACVPALGSGINDGFELMFDNKAIGVTFLVKSIPQVEIRNLG